MDELNNIITLNDENGNNIDFEFLDLLEYNNEEYVILLPLEDDDGQVVILKVEPVPGNPDLESYVAVEDDETLMAVFEIFKDKFKDVFNFS